MANDFTPSIDDFGLEIFTISDNFDRSLVEHKIPFTNINVLEDLGQQRRLTVRCAFYDNASNPADGKIKPGYKEHKLFLNHLKSRNLYEFRHPAYGLMSGSIPRLSVSHDSTQKYVEIIFDFIEEVTVAEKAADFSVLSEISGLLAASQEQKEIAIDKQIQEDLSLAERVRRGALDIRKIELDRDLPVLKQIDDAMELTGAVREYVKSLDTFVRLAEGTLNDIANPASSITNIISYGTTLPGRILYSVDRMVERYVELYSTIRNAPARFVNSFILGIKALRDAQSLEVNQKILTLSGSSRSAYELADLYETDEEKKTALESVERTPQFGYDGEYLGGGPLDTNIMTLDDLEGTLYEVRGFLLEAIEDDRSLRTFKSMAKTLQTHVNDIKVERLRIKNIDVNNTPLHLICSSNGLSYETAERILKLNPSIKNPTFTRGEIKIYAQ